jgi:hypothetical protein
MYATEELRAELQKTAQHLAGQDPDLELIWKHINTLGKCGLHDDRILIQLRPDQEFKSLYEVFLHEAAHALLIHLAMQIHWDSNNLQAIERHAQEQAFVWGVSVGAKISNGTDWRYPKDTPDLLQRLKILQGFGRERYAYYFVSRDGLSFMVRDAFLVDGLAAITKNKHILQKWQYKAS